MAIIKKGIGLDGRPVDYDSEQVTFVPAHDLLAAEIQSEHVAAIGAALQLLLPEINPSVGTGQLGSWQLMARIKAISNRLNSV